MGTMKLSDIKIKESFAKTTPRQEKMNECRRNWNQFHCQDRYIVLDYNNKLIDGYIQYLVLKENNIDEVKVKISNKRRQYWRRINTEDWELPYYKNHMTTYIYGVHPNSNSVKERIWRVPDSWKDWEKDLLPGDKIMVRTSKGVAPIIITKIAWLDKCPINMPIKKVYRKFDENKGE